MLSWKNSQTKVFCDDINKCGWGPRAPHLFLQLVSKARNNILHLDRRSWLDYFVAYNTDILHYTKLSICMSKSFICL